MTIEEVRARKLQRILRQIKDREIHRFMKAKEKLAKLQAESNRWKAEPPFGKCG
jgi:cytoplasmic iron level regulating protein YaaA (DUF328/UPF0246 family)